MLELTSNLLNLPYDMLQFFFKHAHIYQTNDLTKLGISEGEFHGPLNFPVLFKNQLYRDPLESVDWFWGDIYFCNGKVKNKGVNFNIWKEIKSLSTLNVYDTLKLSVLGVGINLWNLECVHSKLLNTFHRIPSFSKPL